MKHLNYFNSHSEYTNPTIRPNVSYCKLEDEVHYNPIPDPFNGHEYIDLGLPSGTLWATMNVGANTEIDYGDYFAWGETEGYNSGKTEFNWSTYKYGTSSSDLTKYNGTDKLIELEFSDDAARVNWKGLWQIPSEVHFQELIDNTTSVFVTDYENSGVAGYTFTANDNTLFLPASAYILNSSFGNINSSALYTSSSLDRDSESRRRHLLINLNAATITRSYRYIGQVIRPIIVPNNFIDLGLSSGTLWATVNIGALSPEDYGNYYSWAEINTYTPLTYKYGDSSRYTKYNLTDNLTELEMLDDIANLLYGRDCYIPSTNQMEELVNNCTWTWGQLNGINGYTVTGNNNNSIFLPAGGYYDLNLLLDCGLKSYYLTRNLVNAPNDVSHLFFDESYLAVDRSLFGRANYAASIRPVKIVS